MKKVILLSFALLAITSVFSQITTLSDAELGFGLEVAVPMSGLKETQKTGIGGSVKFGYGFPNSSLAITTQAGFLSFAGKPIDNTSSPLKQTYAPQSFVPIKAGLRYTFGGGLYAEPQLGGAFIFSEDGSGNPVNTSGLMYAMGVGFQTLPGIDINVHYDCVNFSNGNIAFAGIRLAYHFTFRRQEIY
jgi:hypothetical protein